MADLINWLVTQGGVIALLVVIVIALAYWITNRTVPRELYEQQREDIEDLKTEFRELVGPTFDRMAKMMDMQATINDQLLRQLDVHSQVLHEISKELRLVTHELSIQRQLSSPRTQQEEEEE